MENIVPLNEVISKILTFFTLGMFGVIARRFGYIEEKARSSFTDIVLYITLPSLILVSITNDVKWDDLIKGIFAPLISISLVLIIMAFSFYLGKLIFIKKETIGTFMVLSSMPNSGFLGFPIIFSFFGKEALIYAILFDFGITIAFFSIAIIVLRKELCLEKSVKILLNPAFVSVVLGLIINKFEIPIPNTLFESLNILGDATIPIIMLIMGYTLAGVQLKKETMNYELISVSFIKLIICPCIAYILLLYLNINPLVKSVIIVETAMPTMASASVLVQKYGGNLELATTATFLTTLLSIVTIPFIFKYFIL
ncbi:MAG: AEC family transporter [Atribacterota bacterium]|jgi:predicted permease|nr:AEC family transporter [Atribacterota bacterium]MDD4895196.1 AEC family transporter [Atribacterota bacterium]MDD5637781.1 AEC family transporter [Atribacterota bacterium]